MVSHRRRLLLGSAVVLVASALALGIVTYKRQQRHDGALAYGQAFYLYQMSQADSSPGELAMLIQKFNAVANDYASISAGWQARLLAGSLLMAAGEYASAEESLRQLSNESSLAPEFSALVWGALGQCLEAAGKTDAAVQAYAKAAGLSGPGSANIWRSDQARLLLADNAQQAQDIYRQILNSSRSRFLRFNASSRLTHMGQDAGGLD